MSVDRESESSCHLHMPIASMNVYSINNKYAKTEKFPPRFQSGYQSHYSTEKTVLACLLLDIHTVIHRPRLVLARLNMSATFESVNHNITGLKNQSDVECWSLLSWPNSICLYRQPPI